MIPAECEMHPPVGAPTRLRCRAVKKSFRILHQICFLFPYVFYLYCELVQQTTQQRMRYRDTCEVEVYGNVSKRSTVTSCEGFQVCNMQAQICPVNLFACFTPDAVEVASKEAILVAHVYIHRCRSSALQFYLWRRR